MSRRTLSGIAAVVAAVAALTTACGGGNESVATAQAPARAQATAQASAVAPATLTPCGIPKIPTAKCGSVTVPLDRAHPEAGTTKVGFALVPRTNRSRPSLGTVVTNPGGPGTGAVDLTGHLYAEGLKPILDRRDLLLIDPRGVGRSDPIHCPALENPARVFASVAKQRAAIGACGRQLGAKARYYGTAAVADDFDDVRAALGIDRLDLLGDSYGTYLMPTYVARHPNHVRSVVLSGAYPVNTSNDPVGAVAIGALRRAARLVCERTGSCSGDTVLSDLTDLATKLRAKPVTMDVSYEKKTYTVTLDEWQLAGTVGKIYSGPAAVDTKLALAKALASARTGDLAPVQELVRAHLVEKAGNLTLGSELLSETLTWATTCHDYHRDFDYADSVADRKADFEKAVSRMKTKKFLPFSPKAWLTRDDYDTGACLEWPADPTATAPFPRGTRLADVPTLVLSGDLDANTSSTSGREAAAQFPHARFVEVKNAGHTPTATPDGAKLVMQFIAKRHR
ncbi:alpha/beta fold hydrolase [Streptomyces lunaelactis]|uniref:alpha/beta hydrolase n=1 Tax=Streptomyces lunaelactis TaxID=1535768 RepID=UPI0015848D91|nr:alpha/beta hydrolase [Streptomyces lunaelactis]NUK10306.1 alpha/beta fold hydrolase [Streptomyces lunaelactis]NUK36968.1 alpha/beta fold hydrolase [Streptomyces lunaelactis]NUK44825.1 alpha/beta fold hydrolase [Streptomyces lunaelactis]NUK95389.1 alpha/beta fold hydrolase [Streptomyces lunaelactis]NUL13486.1 alpha/beta fold hydrolase [Streptomyces lunaelactis]